MDIKLGQLVYHKDIYSGRELMEVVGIRKKEVELEGDYSGGTHKVCQKDWHSIDGVIPYPKIPQSQNESSISDAPDE